MVPPGQGHRSGRRGVCGSQGEEKPLPKNSHSSIPASGRGAEQGQGEYNCQFLDVRGAVEALWVSFL